ncbi:MAG TPA: tripartite tricarboxylate transporter substrate binding protein [Noviherbaspirillum sp.]|jgi:tripartite-type tricarboxylate transporter receptor subunit TctC|uniref:Bug family tripartite tricarboxylate transporter substrate binding protein n=1 Tax=Noviherbaspirillum sp. TaxID=1926288 RepID=UPI002DDCEA2F|nr:tripartite tricarboxylate transporter substrate binding protein [Noviherbaspirillum sp.]HEV2609837.1 tripartite tricarboxylate transporter substrate binding protein [Noviherbaspirillum sp.]
MKQLISAAAVTIAALAAVTGAHAAGYPEKPITAVVPFPPGGSTDAIARAIAPKMQAALGQPIVVENKPGATGAIGAGFVKSAPADGYTFMVASIGVYSVNPVLQKKLSYDPSKDFDLLTVAVRAPNVLVATPNFPANSLQDLVAYLKKNPDKVSFASSGAGSSDHLTAALFWQKTGTRGVHVPYKGGAPAITDLIGGHADVSFQNLNVVVGHVKAGKLKALAITGDKRSALLPDVPTLTEAGIKEVDVYSWQGVAAPKGLPKDVKAKLHGAVTGALNDSELKKKLTEQGFEIVANSPEEFARFQAQELARWKNVIEVGKIEID